MPTRKIILYSNQPVIRFGDEYFTLMRNFIDFLGTLARRSEDYELFVPCRHVNEMPSAKWSKIDLPQRVNEVAYYSNYRFAILRSLQNALMIARCVRQELMLGREVVMAGPGPNSFMFWLSLMVPRQTRFAYFIRGDTEKTLSAAYEGSWLHPLVTGLVALFRRRINEMQRRGRAQVFVYGDRLAEKYGGLGERVQTVMPLFEMAEWVGDAPHPAQADGYGVLYVGRMSKEKNLATLVRACAIAKQRGRPFRLTLVGRGEEANALADLINEYDLGGLVMMPGVVRHGADLLALYGTHALFCLPSLTEGVPRVIVEALARRLPVLASAVGSIEEVFAGQVHLLDGFSAETIANAVDWCRDHPDEMRAMTERGHAQVARFDLQSNAERVDHSLRS
jgi:glycosyltransferase involved in cell wall biosynthesis